MLALTRKTGPVFAETIAVPEPAAPPPGITRRLESFATGYQTLVAIIQGVAFGALIATGQDAVFRRGSVPQHLITAGQLITTFTVIVAVTDQYLQLVRAVQWSPKSVDTAVPYVLGVGQVAMATTLGNNARWWGSAAILSLSSAWAFRYSRVRARRAQFAGGKPHYRAFVSTVTAFSIASIFLFACEATMSGLAAAHAGPYSLFVAAPLGTFPLYILTVGLSRKAIERRNVTTSYVQGLFTA